MTIHQLKEPCWVLKPRPYEDDHGDSHYKTWHEADEALRELREERGPDPLDLAGLEPVKPVREAGACWEADCSTCGDELTNEDAGWTIHAASLPELYQSLDAYDWRLCPDEAYCPDCAPECSQIPPLSPAEQEARGQLRLPGVA